MMKKGFYYHGRFFAAALLLLLSAQLLHAKSEFVEIFDGKTLAGWDGDPRLWRVEDGTIVGETTQENQTASNTFLIWEGGDVANFELKVEFKLRNHNSGIQYRSFPVAGKKWVLGGYQADIAENPKYMGIAYGERHKGILAHRGQKTVIGNGKGNVEVLAQLGDSAEILSAIDMDGWNEYHIIAHGNQCIQMINGVVVAEFYEKSEDWLQSGLIGLQLHQGPPMQVKFRNIQLRQLEPGEKKQILFLAGKKSHGYAAHEHNAGCQLLARGLHESGTDVIAHVEPESAWPESWAGYDKPDSVVMYCDGFKRHMAKDHQDKIQALTEAGVGVACLHFATEVAPDELGEQFLDWIGGYFEIGWSVNPTWTATYDKFPDHPITRGVRPFTIRDEWYYHMRFQPEMKGVTPILSTVPPLRTLTSRAKDSNRGSNPTVMAAVEAGEPQHVAWAYQRPDGGRGFGFTGGHYHQNWQQDDFRKVVLNALLWTAKADIPADGVPSRSLSEIDLELNQDYPKPGQQ